MTIIVANRREMAADTLVAGGGAIYHTTKIFRIGDSIVGVAGNVGNTTKFLAWFRKECPSDEVGMTLDEEHTFEGLVLNARGLFYYADCVEPDRIHGKFHAIGAGSDIGATAMYLGKSPREAVKIACVLDPTHCGGKPDVLSLGSVRHKRGKTALPPKGAQTNTPTVTTKES